MGHKWSSVSQLGYRYCTNCQVKMDGTSKLLACPPFTEDEANALNNAADQSHVCPKCKIEFVTRMPKCPICYHRKKSADQSRVIEVLENTLLDVRDKHGVIDCVSYTRKRIVDDYVSHRLWVRDKVNKALAEAQRILEGK